MRIGFLSLPVTGHVNPMTSLARKLQSRGHDVVFISLVDIAPFAEAAGLPFVPCSETIYPAGSMGTFVRHLCELSGEDALHFTVNTMMKGYTASLYKTLPDTLSKAGVDVLVLDQFPEDDELLFAHPTIASTPESAIASITNRLPTNLFDKMRTDPPGNLWFATIASEAATRLHAASTEVRGNARGVSLNSP
jgi:UDP:flavonoid glycosyltransferase YjiC (YdhE family)